MSLHNEVKHLIFATAICLASVPHCSRIHRKQILLLTQTQLFSRHSQTRKIWRALWDQPLLSKLFLPAFSSSTHISVCCRLIYPVVRYICGSALIFVVMLPPEYPALWISCSSVSLFTCEPQAFLNYPAFRILRIRMLYRFCYGRLHFPLRRLQRCCSSQCSSRSINPYLSLISLATVVCS